MAIITTMKSVKGLTFILLPVLSIFLIATKGVGLSVNLKQAEFNKPPLADVKQMVGQYCLDCHTGSDSQAGLDLERLDFAAEQFGEQDFKTQVWEKIIRRLETRQMPPAGNERPNDHQYEAAISAISELLAGRYEKYPQPGRVSSLRRMTRLEYKNSIRDLLGVEIDAESLLPKDESSYGFDNITVDDLSPTHLTRYISAAQKISQAAVGGLGGGPIGVTIRLPPDQSQEEHVAGLPFGTRGGALIKQFFPVGGEYEIEVKLTRDRDERIEGLFGKNEIHVLLNRELKYQFTVANPKKDEDWKKAGGPEADANLRVRIKIPAGTHQLGVTFPQAFSSLVETKRQPFDTNYNRHRHPRRTPAIYQVSIVGPLSDALIGETTPRQLVFGKYLNHKDLQTADVKEILTNLSKRAYRRKIGNDDVNELMSFYLTAREQGETCEQGIERALAALLVSPHFLFKIERPGTGTMNAKTESVNDYELATRLAYFLWSSLPDEELLNLAAENQLNNSEVLSAQVLRMLKDQKSQSLVDNFASQWLYLRNLESMTPDLRLFPDFDDNLRQAFQQETKLLFRDVLQGELNLQGLISSPYTYLNQRLAKHYGIPHVSGSHFRKVAVSPEMQRGGILRHGSILMVTSYATRTAPTIRGKWVLENIFGTPPPPPPPNIPNLKEESTQQATTLRERLAIHRENKACAVCHDLIDPLGFALENYDAVGRLRIFDGTQKIDSQGNMPDGTLINSVAELEANILQKPELFAHTVAVKLMTFALGRAVEPTDGPAIRQIVKVAGQENNQLSSIIKEIVLSPPFRERSIDQQ